MKAQKTCKKNTTGISLSCFFCDFTTPFHWKLYGKTDKPLHTCSRGVTSLSWTQLLHSWKRPPTNGLRFRVAKAWEKMMLASSALTRTSINSPWLTLTLLRVSLSQASYDTSPSIHIGGFGKCSAGEPNSHALLVTEGQDAASATVANQATRWDIDVSSAAPRRCYAGAYKLSISTTYPAIISYQACFGQSHSSPETGEQRQCKM